MSQSSAQDLHLLIDQCPSACTLASSERYPHASHQDGGLELIEISTDKFDAVFSAQGAHLVEFNSKTQGSLLWLSPNAVFKPGKAIRGGIPVCLPWFGAHPSDATKPAHGFVRDANWQLSKLTVDAQGQACVIWRFSSSEATLALYPHEFSAELSFTLGDSIQIELNLNNHSSHTMPASWALHSYFPVDSLSDTKVTGLEGVKCSNKLLDNSCCQLDSAIYFNDEVDQVYEQVPTEQRIAMKDLGDIVINAENSDTCIVWNPGAELAAGMADVGENNHLGFVCVERGAAFGDTWQVKPEEVRSASMSISRSS